MSDNKPRSYTKAEMREMVIDHIRGLASYWAHTDLTRPEFCEDIAKHGETLYRLEGLAFSILVMLDGGSMSTPAFDLTPSPHPYDEAFHKNEGENWWPSDVVINDDVQLHDIWSQR